MRLPALFEAVRAWARTADDIRAAAVVGSHARDAAHPESDVDLIVLSDSPASHCDDTTWSARFGRAVRTSIEDWGRVQAVRVFYEGGLELDMSFAAPSWADVPVEPGTARVVRDGMQTLFDPDDLLGAVARAVSES